MGRASRSVGSVAGRPRVVLLGLALGVVLLFLLAGVSAVTVPQGASPAAPPAVLAKGAAPSSAAATSSVSGATVSPQQNASGFNPYCHPIATGVCVAAANQNETNIVPGPGATVCSARPNSTASIQLTIKSRNPLNWSGTPPPPRFGPNSPIALNVTGVLWNGDLYYNTSDNSIWHANSNIWWTGPTRSSNVSYPWWYGVELTARAPNGGPNFFPGMTIDWWIYLTYFTNNTYSHHRGPTFECTYSGAWPYSPYPGSKQYAGSAAVSQSLNLTVNPASPNWNDSVDFVLNTTQADGEIGINATIGSAYIDLSERAPNGSLIVNASIPFPVIVNGGTGLGNGIGQVTTTAVITARYAQVAGAIVQYEVVVYDTAFDQLVTPWANYTVGGNGSFASGVFTDDIALSTNPDSVITDPFGQATLNPGQSLNITIASRDPTASIYSAQIAYVLTYGTLHESTSGFITLSRLQSTLWQGDIPGLPLATSVNFTVYAWDFTQRLEVSPTLAYSVPTFDVVVPIVPGNSTFFFVYVYDNGSHQWVNGATVQIVGPHNFFNSVGKSTLGVAYPNASGSPYTPLLVAANASYTIFVNDPHFIPPGSSAPPSDLPNATVLALHSMTNRGTLVQASDYLVVQEADSVVFYLNSTPPAPPISPPAYDAVPLTAVIGVIGATVVAVPVMSWWGKIRARRKEEEKRVTL